MVSLRIIEIREREKLITVKVVAGCIFMGCALLAKGSRGRGGDSILQSINSNTFTTLLSRYHLSSRLPTPEKCRLRAI
jgi:hypothetical protein